MVDPQDSQNGANPSPQASGRAMEGRVSAVYKDKCLVWNPDGEWVCTWRGRLKRSQRPVVGDRVTFEPQPEDTGEIVEFLPRHSMLIRTAPNRGRSAPGKPQVLAANVDQVVIVASMRQPPFRKGLVYRFLVAAYSAGLVPLLCVTKLDLDEQGEFNEWAELFGGLGIAVIGTRMDRPDSLHALLQALTAHTSILVGHSGVGKTSLLNLLTKRDMRVADVGFSRDRGRHTTSTARMIPLLEGGLAIDSPGIREFGLHAITPEGLAEHFPGFGPYLGQCRFRDCRHRVETGCAVREAVEQGALDTRHYDAFCKLLDEILED